MGWPENTKVDPGISLLKLLTRIKVPAWEKEPD